MTRATTPKRGKSLSWTTTIDGRKFKYTLYPELPIEQLKPYEANPRDNDQAVEAVAGSIRRFGFNQLLAVGPDFRICAGDTRYKSARRLRMTKVPVLVAQHLTGNEFTGYNIADNQTASLADFNLEQLPGAIAELQAANDDDLIEALGFDDQALNKILNDQGSEPASQDDVPDTPKKATSRRGDLWAMGEHRLYVGDATDGASYKALLNGDRPALVFTDPPYGVTHQGWKQTHIKNQLKNDKLEGDDLLKFLTTSLKLAAHSATKTAGFYICHPCKRQTEFSQAALAAGLEEKQTVVWVKESFTLGRGDYQYQSEFILYAQRSGEKAEWYGGRDQSSVWWVTSQAESGELHAALANGIRLSDGAGHELYLAPKAPKTKKIRLIRLAAGQPIAISGDIGQSDVWQINRDAGQAYEHPTQKPVALAQRSIENSSKIGELVLDPFLGSGSTLIAADKTGRQCAGFELEPRFADVVVERWQRWTGGSATRTRP